MAPEWEVYLADGTTRDSSHHHWEDVPDGVLVVRIWDPPGGDLIDWGNSWYGQPGTLKMEGRVSDEEFARILELAHVSHNPPSQR